MQAPPLGLLASFLTPGLSCEYVAPCAADLVPREVAERWLKYLREELPTVAFRCSTQRQAANLTQRSAPVGKGAAAKRAAAAAKAEGREAGRGSGRSALNGSACLGAETLLQLLKNYARNLDIKTAITVGANALCSSYRPAIPHCVTSHAA